MIGEIINAARDINGQLISAVGENSKQRTNADGTLNMDDANKGIAKEAAMAALTDPSKLLGIIGRKKALRKQQQAQQNAYNTETISTADTSQNTALKDGGEVKDGESTTPADKGGVLVGEGGPKDDAIPATLNKGDVVIPADADQEIVGYILSRLGLDKPVDQRDAEDGSGTSVRLSNGETIIPAQYVQAAEEIANELGTSLEELMPNSKSTISENEGYAEGVIDPLAKAKVVKVGESQPIGGVNPIGSKTPNTIAPSVSDISKKPAGIGDSSKNPANVAAQRKGKAKMALSSIKNAVSENANELLGAAQAGIGAMMGSKAGSRPSYDSSSDSGINALQAKNAKAKAISELKTGMDENAEQAYRLNMDNAVRQSPGSASAIAASQEAAAKLASDKNETTRAVAEAKLAAAGSDAQLAEQVIKNKQQDTAIKQDAYDKSMTGASNLISTGINNVMGARNLKNARKMLKELGRYRNVDPLKDSLD